MNEDLVHKCTTTNTNTNTNTKKKKKRETDLDKIINLYTKNENLKEAIRDFLKMRKAIKKPATDKALSLILKKLDKLYSSSDAGKIEILNQSIENSWQGVFELKNKNGINDTQRPQIPYI